MLSLSCIREIKKVTYTYINDFFLSILSITYSVEVVTKKIYFTIKSYLYSLLIHTTVTLCTVNISIIKRVRLRVA